MKILLTSLTIVLIATSCMSNMGIEGNKTIVSKEIKIEDYSQIQISGICKMVYEQKAEESSYFKVEIDENLVQYLDIKTQGNMLNVEFREQCNPSEFIVYTNSTSLTDVDASGASNLDLKGKINSDKLSITLSGAVEAKADELKCKNLIINSSGSTEFKIENALCDNISIDSSGAADLDLSGTSKNCEIDASGATEVNAYNLTISEAKCEASGAANIKISVSNILWAEANGAGNLFYKGSPAIANKSTSGAGNISVLNKIRNRRLTVSSSLETVIS